MLKKLPIAFLLAGCSAPITEVTCSLALVVVVEEEEAIVGRECQLTELVETEEGVYIVKYDCVVPCEFEAREEEKVK